MERSREVLQRNAVEKLYAAGTGELEWTEALAAVCQATGAKSANLTRIDPMDQRTSHFVVHGVDQGVVGVFVRDYQRDIFRLHPRMPHFARMEQGRCAQDLQWWSAAEMRRIPFFAELVHPAGIQHALHCFPRKGSDGAAWVEVTLHFHRQAALEAGEPALAPLQDHLRRAYTLGEQLGAAQLRGRQYAEALDQVSDALASLDVQGRLVFANASARKLFAAGHGLSLARDGRIVLADPDARRCLARALTCCPVSSDPFVARRLDRRPLRLQLLPLGGADGRRGGAVALLTLRGPEAAQPTPLQMLQRSYRLTPAEAQLAQALATGVTLKRFAQQQELGYETVRTYLRRIMAKTGTHRQADLVRLVMGAQVQGQ